MAQGSDQWTCITYAGVISSSHT